MRRNASTVVVLVGPVPGEVLAAVGRSMNVALIRPEDPADSDSGGVEAAAGALRRAGRVTSPYALVPADPLAAVAESWRAMWDISRPKAAAGSSRPQAAAGSSRPQAAVRSSRPQAGVSSSRPRGVDEFEREAVQAVTAWRAGRFELPDYYLVLAEDQAGDHGPDFYLGPLRSTRPHRVVVVAATEPAQQAAGVLQALGSLRHGPWWPGLDELIETARRFYPGSLVESSAALVGH